MNTITKLGWNYRRFKLHLEDEYGKRGYKDQYIQDYFKEVNNLVKHQQKINTFESVEKAIDLIMNQML